MKLSTTALSLLVAAFATAAPLSKERTTVEPTTTSTAAVTTSHSQTGQANPQASNPQAGPSAGSPSGLGPDIPSSSSSSNATDGTADTAAAIGHKRGLLYTDASINHLFPNPPITWSYDYQSTAGTGTTKGEFVPMLYNGQDPNWHTNAAAAIKHGSNHLLAFNEPDQPTSVGGTSISPAQAASIYKAKMNPFKGQAQLGAPAVSAGGISWLQQFAQACNGGCHVDFIPLHFYASAGQSAKVQAESFKGFLAENIPKVRGFFKNNNLPIWVTEFAALPNTNIDVKLSTQYMDDVLPYLDSHQDIARYSYFYGNELVSGGGLNGAGKRYIGAS